jgi:hypothetical protein
LIPLLVSSSAEFEMPQPKRPKRRQSYFFNA